MPCYYIHIRAAGLMMERLKAGVPAGSPLTQQEANALFEAAHQHRNYFAAGVYGPDLFFLLPDFMGDTGKMLSAIVDFGLTTWKKVDEEFISHWEKWVSPVLDETNTLASGISGGMLGEVSQALSAFSDSFKYLALDFATQMEDLVGMLTSGVQTGYEDSSFFWSDMFHYRRTYQFARALYRNAMLADENKPVGEPSRVPKQQAFALGWMSHCATDVVGHPYVNSKCGGPYRTHWQRHHLIENHMDAFVYGQQQGQPNTAYNSLATSALHFTLAFSPGGAGGSDDAPLYDYFPSSFSFPPYPEGETDAEKAARKNTFDQSTEPLPEHICELILKTMQDVFTTENDSKGPQVLRWDPGKHVGDGGRPTAKMLQDMYQLVFDYIKFSSSSGLSPRAPRLPEVITDHSLPMPPGMPDDSAGADPNESQDLNLLDILLAALAYGVWLADVIVWAVTLPAAVVADLATWPLRELLYQILVIPAWNLYKLARLPLVLEGFLTPGPDEVSRHLVVLGESEKGPLIQLRADLDDPSGFAPMQGPTEPSGLDSTLGASTGGFSVDPAYPRAVVTDLSPAWSDSAAIDSDTGPSEFVAPWRYPAHNMAGMRVGWEAPRTHAAPYMQGQDPGILMGNLPGSDDARHKYEAALTPDETEHIAATLMSIPHAHLGDAVDYSAYVIGQLTGAWAEENGKPVYKVNDDNKPLPDFNLDGDRGYGHLCWDYLRHPPSLPPVPQTQLDKQCPDQWRCIPQMPTFLSEPLSPEEIQDIVSRYGFQEPYTVPQRYNPGDNPHHRTVYDPLKRIAYQYIPRQGDPPLGSGGIDLQVSSQEMKDVGMSPTGRLVK